MSQRPCTFQLRCGHQLPKTRTETANKRVFNIQDLLIWCWTAPVKSVRSHVPSHSLQSPSWEYLVLTLGLTFLFLSRLQITTTPGLILKIAFQLERVPLPLTFPETLMQLQLLIYSWVLKYPSLEFIVVTWSENELCLFRETAATKSSNVCAEQQQEFCWQSAELGLE